MGMGITYYILQVIQHEKLNLHNNPCEPDPEYSLAQCVEENIMRNAGCKPPWRRFDVIGLPLCDNLQLLAKYAQEYERISSMVRSEILDDTKCLMPCTFMEYKVEYFCYETRI